MQLLQKFCSGVFLSSTSKQANQGAFIDTAVKVATVVLTSLKLPIDKFFLLARSERPIKFLLTLSAVACTLYEEQINYIWQFNDEVLLVY